MAKKKKKKYRVGIQVIKVYDIDVDACSEEEAESKAYNVQSTTIEEKGKLISVETDYAVAHGPVEV